jgi:hypothetical protein
MLEETMEDGSDLLLSIVVKMELKKNAVNGHLVFILNADSMNNLYKTLNLMLEKNC